MGTHFGEAFFLVLYGSIPAIIAFVWFWHINEIYKASTGARQVFGEWIFWWIARIVGFVVHIGGVAAVLTTSHFMIGIRIGIVLSSGPKWYWDLPSSCH